MPTNVEQRSLPLINLADSQSQGEGNANAPGYGADVVGTYNWTMSLSPEARAQVPTIEIQEYQQSLSSIRQAIIYFTGQIGGILGESETQDPYENLYAVDLSEPGNRYVLPFYSNYHHIISNSWGENKGVIGKTINTIEEVITEVGRAVFPSAGIEAAKAYEGTQPAAYQFSFHLMNTIEPEIDIDRNKTFINALINNNLLDKIDFVAIRPPAICSIKIPGIRGTTVGVLSNITIQNMGQINKIGNHNIPDAYLITITVQELLTESRQIWADQLSDGRVFANVASEIQGIQSAGEIIGEEASGLLNRVQNIFNLPPTI